MPKLGSKILIGIFRGHWLTQRHSESTSIRQKTGEIILILYLKFLLLKKKIYIYISIYYLFNYILLLKSFFVFLHSSLKIVQKIGLPPINRMEPLNDVKCRPYRMIRRTFNSQKTPILFTLNRIQPLNLFFIFFILELKTHAKKYPSKFFHVAST